MGGCRYGGLPRGSTMEGPWRGHASQQGRLSFPLTSAAKAPVACSSASSPSLSPTARSSVRNRPPRHPWPLPALPALALGEGEGEGGPPGAGASEAARARSCAACGGRPAGGSASSARASERRIPTARCAWWPCSCVRIQGGMPGRGMGTTRPRLVVMQLKQLWRFFGRQIEPQARTKRCPVLREGVGPEQLQHTADHARSFRCGVPGRDTGPNRRCSRSSSAMSQRLRCGEERLPGGAEG